MPNADENVIADLEARLDAIDDAMEAEDLAQALVLARDLVAKYPDQPESVLTLAEVLADNERLDEARDLLKAFVAREPEFAEAHYLLGMIEEELDNSKAAIAAFLEVLRLDTEDDASDGIDWREHEEAIVEAALATIDALPPFFKKKLDGVPVILEARPAEALVREGFDPRALGMFEGRTDAEVANNDVAETPTRIVLYGANLVAAYPMEDELIEEVGVTIVHEMGHYYGLEEEDMERLGIE